MATVEIALWIVGIYLVAGATVAYATWEPEQGGWFWAMLLWPVVIYGCCAR